jgi:fatty-acyl-CoA synthase
MTLGTIFERVGKTTDALRILNDTGVLSPSFLLTVGRGVAHYGAGPASGIAGAAGRHPDTPALVDEDGSLSFRELNERTNAIAHGLKAAGVGAGHGVGILCRNHRAFVEATLAVGKLGADALFLNTGFAALQLADVLEREKISTLIYDEDFAAIVEEGSGNRQRFLGWCEGTAKGPSLEALAEKYPRTATERPTRTGAATILTSGTTGTPKGAKRQSQTTGFDSLIGILEKLPIRAGDVNVIAAPTFHSWGLVHFLFSCMLGSTMVMRRRFDPEATLAMIAENRATTLAVVPVMMQRILELPPEVIGKYDTSSLRITASSGSALPGELALRWMDTFGDNLVNFYGSTEVSQASIATPEDLRAAPGTAGRVPRGAQVKILDDQGRELPQGEVGRIFVGNEGQFDGYTGGGTKEVIDGLMSIGDVGYFDEEGRLFVGGRDDEMIVSGGENVFPREVEDLLADHEAVSEAAVIGVEDEEFGQRLKAFIVLREGKAFDADQVRTHVKEQLARHKVPRDVEYLDELPRNPTGKVLKRLLK